MEPLNYLKKDSRYPIILERKKTNGQFWTSEVMAKRLIRSEINKLEVPQSQDGGMYVLKLELLK